MIILIEINNNKDKSLRFPDKKNLKRENMSLFFFEFFYLRFAFCKINYFLFL